MQQAAQHLRTRSDDLALVASDLPLLHAASAKGLNTFNRDIQDHAALAALVGPSSCRPKGQEPKRRPHGCRVPGEASGSGVSWDKG
jgi:hypothetical protein